MKSHQSPVDMHWLMQVTCNVISFIFFISAAWQQSGTRTWTIIEDLDTLIVDMFGFADR